MIATIDAGAWTHRLAAREGRLLPETFLSSVGALLLGTTLLRERLDRHQIAGMPLIFAGFAAIDGHPLVQVCRLLGGRLAANTVLLAGVKGGQWPRVRDAPCHPVCRHRACRQECSRESGGSSDRAWR